MSIPAFSSSDSAFNAERAYQDGAAMERSAAARYCDNDDDDSEQAFCKNCGSVRMAEWEDDVLVCCRCGEILNAGG